MTRVNFQSKYNGNVIAYQSTSDKDLYFYVIGDHALTTPIFVVIGEKVGFEPTEATDDWFATETAAHEIACEMATN